VRVLAISSLWPPALLGGAEIYAARLAEQLRARGHDVGAVTLGVEGADVVETATPWPYRLDSYVEQPSWRRAAFHARDVYDPTAARVVRRAIARFKPDVVHSHAVAGLSAAAVAAPSVAGVPHVHHLHDYWLLCQRSSFTTRDGGNCNQRCTTCVTISATRRLLLRAHRPDVLIAPSEYVARVHRRLEWTRDRMHVLHLPSDVTAPIARRPNDGTLTFGYIGQLSTVKGVRTLLRAFRLIDSDARLLVAGRGALEPEVAGDGITALGWVDDAARDDFWRSIDCLVVPSEWAEPGGTVAVEGRGRGLPVIAANAGGMVESVDDASKPLIFEPGDAEGLAGSMRRFIADPPAFAPAATAGWRTWPDQAVEVERLYEVARETRRSTT
jgi:glycosyltransferase involved in cell wall biosynthesis